MTAGLASFGVAASSTADVSGAPERWTSRAPLLEMFPLLNIIGTVGLGAAALSYAGSVQPQIAADADAYPTSRCSPRASTATCGQSRQRSFVVEGARR